MKRDDDKVIQRAINLFLVLFLVIGSVMGGTAATLYWQVRNSFFEGLRAHETHAVEIQSAAIRTEFNAVASDLLFLAEQNELHAYLDSGQLKLKTEIQNEYIRMAHTKKVYDQIRYLDATGHEVVRVNFAENSPYPVPDKQLQNKNKRYYFTDSLSLEKGDIFVSPLDLNMEKGEVEQPLKPMIRFGTPVFDSSGTKRGVIIFNYKAARLLDSIVKGGDSSFGEKMLLNPDGYWLLNPEKDQEWGFMFPDKNENTIDREYPEEWRKVLETGTGQFLTDNGLFTFVTITPLRGSNLLPADSPQSGEGVSDYFWVLLTHVPPAVIKAQTNDLMLKLFFGGGGLFLLIAFGAWHLAMAVTRRKIYQAQLRAWALYDSLTGLPNRKLFFDKLDEGISHAKRHERKLGLLYLDLDGFKAINDTHGHAAGDELLIQVGQRLKKIVRKSDTVARLGGDEFAIVLTEIKRVEAPAIVGQKIVDLLCRPFMLKVGEVNIGVNVGVAVYPDHEDDEQALIKSADKAMYVSKSKGKNTCTSAGDKNE